ncbi:MAG: aminotransferase class I/II-fold pyridoxal phosphate-dependent enzyme, partial [Emcibacteraceae bacterium]|nr:aminotransferase class I/II-fold pyridoxal phosphate-dependent enzyme [Emcibacteraceae bacterium]
MNSKVTKSRRQFIVGAGVTTLIAGVAAKGNLALAQSNGGKPFDQIYNRVGVNSIKWDAAIRRYGKDKIVVPMGIADMDFKVDPAITAAINKRAKNEIYGYEMVSDSYYQSIIDWNKQRYGLELKREWIKNSSALKPSLVAALRGLNPVKGKVILQTPTYSGFKGAINRAGMRVEMNPMKKIDGRWHMDLEDLESRLDYETKCLILCNPNNPSGECWSADELRALGDVCMRHGVTVLCDEIWCDFVRDGERYTPYASIGEKYAEHSITFKSVSKSFNQA